MVLSDQGTTSVAVKYGDTQLAVYHVPKRGLYATQQMYVYPLFFSLSNFPSRCPHRRAFVLDHGIIGDTLGGELVSHLLIPVMIHD
jgi:nitrite reductase (NAD(P)H)